MMKDENKLSKRESPQSTKILDNCADLESRTNHKFYHLAIGLHPLGKKFDAPLPLDYICWTTLELNFGK